MLHPKTKPIENTWKTSWSAAVNTFGTSISGMQKPCFILYIQCCEECAQHISTQYSECKLHLMLQAKKKILQSHLDSKQEENGRVMVWNIRRPTPKAMLKIFQLSTQGESTILCYLPYGLDTTFIISWFVLVRSNDDIWNKFQDIINSFKISWLDTLTEG